MLNGGAAVDEAVLRVMDGVELHGAVNVGDAVVLANVASAIRRPYPQVRPHAPNYDRVCLVGGGPSLADTWSDLRDLVFAGAKLVTVNGAYRYCLDRNLQPKAQIVMDARASNARFVDPELPQCRYVLASQCSPELWDAVEGRPDVWMFHAAAGGDDAMTALLDRHYLKRWYGVGGGTTVITRAISVLRTLGYLRFDLFGVDSCWLGDTHHAYPQPENEHDRRLPFLVQPSGRPDLAREFWCAPWHVKQAEDFLQMIRVNGDQFQLQVHGPGLLAFLLESGAACDVTPADNKEQ